MTEEDFRFYFELVGGPLCGDTYYVCAPAREYEMSSAPNHTYVQSEYVADSGRMLYVHKDSYRGWRRLRKKRKGA